ncbi:MAG TPA: PQQ-dependent sugar dehydrogenase [Methylibium sp.]|uniref:PQQ-dependent sugar dehydrogenase n=1 Tax=Methylibium sp. TaxID=2067992 RepID=UPI002DB8FFA1|nr:PQQ-dependent sugar dehydrogenase [Methylibium sp.]HEU4458796.1 PQQ-dependent sugar dehydrogenase [Methylibium sp.]
MNASPEPRSGRRTAERRLRWLALCAAGLAASCGGGGDAAAPAPAPVAGAPSPAPGPAAAPSPSPSPPAQAPSAPTAVATVASGLDHPWGLAFLPDGRFLVTERAGRLRLISTSGGLTTISGLPAVQATGQGGLLDIALDPAFASNQRIYWSYNEAGSGAEAGRNGLAVARGVLDLASASVGNVQVILRQTPKVAGSSGHFGGRIAFGRDGHLFVTMGDRQNDSERGYAQDLSRGHGKVARIHADGTIPADNPFVATAGARSDIWSYGHRNPQGAAVHPATGELWSVEHGPQGGDELNVVRAGRNFGWPLISHGCEYGATPADRCTPVGGATSAPAMEQPLAHWVPYSTAPSGLMFYTGSRFGAWTGKLFAGALSGRTLWRFDIDNGGSIACTPPGGQAPSNCSEVPLVKNLNLRIRDVRQGPQGHVFLLTDQGGNADRLLRLD